MLSSRCLVFLAGRAFFQCQRSTYSEDIVEDPTSLMNSSAEMELRPAVYFNELSIFVEYAV
jgi:predicted chitinase